MVCRKTPFFNGPIIREVYNQPYYIEVWIEKDSLTGSIENTVKMEIANLFNGINKPIVIFYIGDFDPSGVDIERDLLAKIVESQRTDNHPKKKTCDTRRGYRTV